MNPTLVRLTKNISSIVLIALSLLLVFGAFMPIFTISTDKIPLDRGFREGAFTRGIEVEEFTVGGNHILSLIKEGDYYKLVFSVQNREERIRKNEESIIKYTELYASTQSSTYLERIDILREEIAEEELLLQEELSTITEEEGERLEHLLQDDDFLDTLAFVYGMLGFFDVVGESFTQKSSYGVNIAPMLVTLLTVIMMAGVVITALILAIASLIGFIKRLIYFIKHIKDWDSFEISRAYPNALPAFLMILLTLLGMMFLYGSSLRIGSGMILLGIVWLVSNIIRTLNLVFAERNNKARIITIVKQGITILSLVAIVLVCAGFYGLDFTGHYLEESNLPGEAYVDRFVEDATLTPDYDINDAIYEGRKGAEKRVEKNTALILLGSYLAALFMVITLSALVERNGMRTASRKYGNPRPYGNQIAAAVLLTILLTFGINFFLVETPKEREEAFDNGSYVAILDAYKLEGTEEHATYELAKASLEALDKRIPEIEAQLPTVTDEAVREELQHVLDQMLKARMEAVSVMEKLESFGEKNLSLARTFLIILLILEVLYVVVPKVLEKVLPEMGEASYSEAAAPASAPHFGGDGNSTSSGNQFANVNFKP